MTNPLMCLLPSHVYAKHATPRPATALRRSGSLAATLWAAQSPWHARQGYCLRTPVGPRCRSEKHPADEISLKPCEPPGASDRDLDRPPLCSTRALGSFSFGCVSHTARLFGDLPWARIVGSAPPPHSARKTKQPRSKGRRRGEREANCPQLPAL